MSTFKRAQPKEWRLSSAHCATLKLTKGSSRAGGRALICAEWPYKMANLGECCQHLLGLHMHSLGPGPTLATSTGG